MHAESRLLLSVLVPLGAAGLAVLLGERRRNLREGATLAASLLLFALTASLLPTVKAGNLPEVRALSLSPGLSLHLKADEMGLLFALLSSFLWILTSVYNVGYLRAGKLPRQTAYYAAFAVCLSAATGIAFAANPLTFFLFYELLTVATYPLVTHDRTPEALAAGRKYLAYTLAAGQALLLTAVWLEFRSPGFTFTPGGAVAWIFGGAEAVALFVLFLLGVGVKCAIMPLHPWLPAAMVAPTPVSALLHAVAVVKAGAFGVLRVCGWVFGPEVLAQTGCGPLLALLASATIVLASLRALAEPNLKRRLAYSTVSQLSYIALGAGLAAPAAFFGAAFHVAAHGFLKITLFFAAGSSYLRSHETEIPRLEGWGRRLPVTFGAFALGALGLVGTPLWMGFISKWNLGWGAVEAGRPEILLVLVLSALLNFAYFFPILRLAFFPRRPEPLRWREGSWMLWGPPAVTGVLSLLLGIFPDAGFSFLTLAWKAAERAAQGGLM